MALSVFEVRNVPPTAPSVDDSATPAGGPSSMAASDTPAGPSSMAASDTPAGPSSAAASDTPASAAPTPTESIVSGGNATPSQSDRPRKPDSMRANRSESGTPSGLVPKKEPLPEGTSASGVSDVATTDDDGEDEKTKIKDQKKDQIKTDEEEDEDAEDDDDDELLPEAEPSKPRREVDMATAKFREEAIHVYGLDFLTSEHMIEIFSQFHHKYIEWIDDTCANVVFKDAMGARRALESLSYPRANDEPWRRTPDILVNDGVPPVFLQLRLALPNDVKIRKKKLPKAPEFWKALHQGARPEDAIVQRKPFDDTLKRKYDIPATEEELAKRRKRGDRFGPGSKASAKEANGQKTAQANKMQHMVATSEELERRNKRAERFSSPPSPKAPASAQTAAAPSPAIAIVAGDSSPVTAT